MSSFATTGDIGKAPTSSERPTINTTMGKVYGYSERGRWNRANFAIIDSYHPEIKNADDLDTYEVPEDVVKKVTAIISAGVGETNHDLFLAIYPIFSANNSFLNSAISSVNDLTDINGVIKSWVHFLINNGYVKTTPTPFEISEKYAELINKIFNQERADAKEIQLKFLLVKEEALLQ